MIARYIDHFKKFDWILFIVVFLLISFGLAAIYSVNLSLEGNNFLNFKKQLIFAGIGLALLFIFSFVDYRIFRSYSHIFYAVGIIALLGVILLGVKIRGTRGWYQLGGFTFQPVELVKLFSIIFMAKYFSTWARSLDKFRHIILSGLGVFVYFMLVAFQPDFGSAIILFLLWLGSVLVIGIKKSHLAVIGLILVLISTFSWFFLLAGYQQSRIMTFLNPAADPLGRGYNITQSTIAIGAGQLFGRGLGFGSQSQLKFLPESQTDFIFAVIAEELGFAGVALILVFFGLLLFRLFRVFSLVRNDFELFLVLGIMILFFSHILINVGMNLGIAPVTGISLPFLSYGGSFLITSLLMIGIVQNIIISSKA
ncbi:MAG TPA: rod shape-determining protein RodA [Patescibacteria group bacterium]